MMRCLSAAAGRNVRPLLGAWAPGRKLQTKCACKTDGPAPANLVPPIVHEVLRSGGSPLEAKTRVFFEPRFGHDFSSVRVHSGALAAESARRVNARAYTVGNDIVLGLREGSPETTAGKRLLAHELTHSIQQRSASMAGNLTFSDAADKEREADAAAAAVSVGGSPAASTSSGTHSVARQKLQPDPPLEVEREFAVQPHVVPLEAKAEPEREKCEEMPGGSTDCDVDENTGTPTGKVTHRVDETNPCVKPCVEKHEGVHLKQMRSFCPELRSCYLSADKGKRPQSDCFKLAVFGNAQRECEAYNISVPCVENRLKTAAECRSKKNAEYGNRKLASEKCFQQHYCASSGKK